MISSDSQVSENFSQRIILFAKFLHWKRYPATFPGRFSSEIPAILKYLELFLREEFSMQLLCYIEKETAPFPRHFLVISSDSQVSENFFKRIISFAKISSLETVSGNVSATFF